MRWKYNVLCSTCRPESHYGGLVVAGEGLGAVVHDAANVVLVGGEPLVLGEVILPPPSDVLPLDGHIVVPVMAGYLRSKIIKPRKNWK